MVGDLLRLLDTPTADLPPGVQDSGGANGEPFQAEAQEHRDEQGVRRHLPAQPHRDARPDACLDDRERRVIVRRYGLDDHPPQTQREIAAQCGISRSYVSRIEKRALQTLEIAMDGWRPG